MDIGIEKHEHFLHYLNLGGSRESAVQLCELLRAMSGILIASVKEYAQYTPLKDAGKSIIQIARHLYILELIASRYMGELEPKADRVL